RSPSIGPANEFPPETDREDVRLHAKPSAHEIMTELMDEDQRPDHEQEACYRPDKTANCRHAAILCITWTAFWRASASIATTSARVCREDGPYCARTCSTTAAISRKPICPLRNAATAASFAALRIAGRAPPSARAALAIARAGKRS